MSKSFVPFTVILVQDTKNTSMDYIFDITPNSFDTLRIVFRNGARIHHNWNCPRSYLIGYIRNLIDIVRADQDTSSKSTAIQLNIPHMPEILCAIGDKVRLDAVINILEDHLCFLLSDMDKYWPVKEPSN